ncbi:MAG: NADH-quinone oxidoreductase subunit H [bacterium]
MELNDLFLLFHNIFAKIFESHFWSLKALGIMESVVKAAVLFAFVYLGSFFIYIWEKVTLKERENHNKHWISLSFICFFKGVIVFTGMLFRGKLLPRFVGRITYACFTVAAFVCLFLINAAIPFGKDLVAYNSQLGVLYILPLLFLVGLLKNYSILLEEQYNKKDQNIFGESLLSGQLTLFLSIIPVVFLTDSINIVSIVSAQQGFIFKYIPQWIIFYPLIGQLSFIIFTLSCLMIYYQLSNGGANKISRNNFINSMRYESFASINHPGFFPYLNQYVFVFTVSGLAVALFFGGGQGPVFGSSIWFVIKMFCVASFLSWINIKLIDLRIKNLFKYYWKGIIPLAFINFILCCLGHIIK